MILQELTNIITSPIEVKAFTQALRENPQFKEGRGKNFGLRFRDILTFSPGFRQYKEALAWAIKEMEFNLSRCTNLDPESTYIKEAVRMWVAKNSLR